MDRENQQIIETINQLKRDTEQLKHVDMKLENLNNLMVQIRDSIISSRALLAMRELALNEMRVDMLSRTRESENSMRDVKSQKGDVEQDVESKVSTIIDTVIDGIEAFEVAHQANIDRLFNVLKNDINDMKKRVTLVERQNIFKIATIVVITLIAILIP